jgi:hypothetical protein
VGDESPMISKTVLEDQYARTDRLTARQSLWSLRTSPALHTVVLDRAALVGTETIVDVGCGNGTYTEPIWQNCAAAGTPGRSSRSTCHPRWHDSPTPTPTPRWPTSRHCRSATTVSTSC